MMTPGSVLSGPLAPQGPVGWVHMASLMIVSPGRATPSTPPRGFVGSQGGFCHGATIWPVIIKWFVSAGFPSLRLRDKVDPKVNSGRSACTPRAALPENGKRSDNVVEATSDVGPASRSEQTLSAGDDMWVGSIPFEVSAQSEDGPTEAIARRRSLAPHFPRRQSAGSRGRHSGRSAVHDRDP